jgi:hypothetical protein
LWLREARAGREEGRKDRPAAVMVVTAEAGGEKRVLALPITHSPPKAGSEAVEIPLPVKARLGLDGDRSWVVIAEANVFAWPGPDIRPATAERFAYGVLPPAFFRHVRDRFLALDAARRATITRTE